MAWGRVRDDVNPYMTPPPAAGVKPSCEEGIARSRLYRSASSRLVLYARSRCQREPAQLSGGEIQLEKMGVFWACELPKILGVHKKVNSRRATDKYREIGRRDWTRTNDPHHVKVVL